MTKADIATSFLRMCSRGEVRAAYERFVAPGFVHHNAWFPGDRQSLLEAMEQAAAAEPNKSFEVKQVVEGGDRVVVHSHLKRADGEVEYAVVHIARFGGDGKIAELWDLAQEGGLPFEMRPVTAAEVWTADELWLSSSTKEVIAIVTLDGQPVGHASHRGKPGPLLRRMHELFQASKQRLG